MSTDIEKLGCRECGETVYHLDTCRLSTTEPTGPNTVLDSERKDFGSMAQATAESLRQACESERRLEQLRDKFIRPDYAFTEDYLNAERLAGSEDAPSRCYACGEHTIVNNVCGNCGKDSRARFGDFRGPVRPLTFKGDDYEVASTIQIATVICEECGLSSDSPELLEEWSQIGESRFVGALDGLASYCPTCTAKLRGQPVAPVHKVADSPWCEPCQSYHPYPQTIEHWRELGCKADRRDFPAPQITCTRCREGNHKLCDRGDGQQCACPCPYFTQATTVEPPARVWIRPGDAEAAEICAEMAREATTIAARHASNFRESGSDTDADLKLRYEAMSEALREAQRRIESELAATSTEHVSEEQIVYNIAQRDVGFRRHLIEQLTAMGDTPDYGELRKLPAATSIETPSDNTISAQFHKIWTSQVGTEGYDKDQWQTLRTLLDQRGIRV